MPRALAKIDRSTTTERVAQSLREAILSGHYAPGEKLPPERDLAVSLGITRVTLRSALARLSSAGLLATVQGDGHRVKDVRMHGGLDRLPDMVAALEHDHRRAAKLVSDLLALRRVVMAEACALVCERPEREWAELRDIANAMAEALDDQATFARYDQAFTRAIMRISGNVAFELTWNTVVSLAEGRPELLDVLYADRERLLLGVRALLTLLAMRDVNRTRELVRTALEGHDQAMITEALTKRKP